MEYLVEQGAQQKTSAELYKINADKYIEIMSSADATDVDIIVFPEMCLNSRLTAVLVPTENDDVDLCTNDTYDENLRNIACAARDLKKYVVINIIMKRNCSEVHAAEHKHDDHDHDHEEECPKEWLLYNTNVVFDRQGKVISLYGRTVEVPFIFGHTESNRFLSDIESTICSEKVELQSPAQWT